MSYEFPFSKPAGWPIRKVILLGLIVVHAVWIVIHLNLVSRELINPWKLGGYGMYTTAHPKPVLLLYDRRFDGFEITLNAHDYAKLGRENRYFIFRCQPITLSSVHTLLKDNPRFVGVPLRFIVSERRMLRDPIRPKRVPHAIFEIRWTGQSTFDYAGKVCGKIYNGESELKP